MTIDSLEKFPHLRKDWQEKENKKGKKFFLFLFLFLIILFFGLIVYLFISRSEIFQRERSVELKFERLDKILVGRDFTQKISIFNRENSDLVNLELLINFPEDFYFKSAEPACSKNFPKGCLINFSAIKKERKEEIKIEGKIFGKPQEKKNFTANLTFQLANFSSWFKKEDSGEIVLETHQFYLEIQGSQELINGEEGEFRIKVRNEHQEPVETKIILSFPKDFQFSFFEPLAEEIDLLETEKSWLLNFAGMEEKDINFKGFFSSKIEEEKKFKLEIGLISPEKKFFSQQEKEFRVKLLQPGLVSGLRINNSFLEEQAASFGQTINFNLSYKNIGQEKISDLLIKFRIINSEFLNLGNLSSLFWTWQSGEKNIEGNQWKIETTEDKYLFWDKSQIKNLEGIDPGQEGEIIFSLPLRFYEEVSKIKPINPYLNFSFVIEANFFRRQLIIFRIESNEIKLKIDSKVKLETEARYFDDQGLKIGSGPIPPKVGETTTYILFFRPLNTTNEIKNVRIKTFLPEKITWLGEEKTSIGNLLFDSFLKQITWQIDTIPTYSGGPHSYLEASFKIGLTPSEDDRGKILTLLEKTILEAEDSFTGAKIYLEARSLDTNLEFDDWAKGRGVVE